MAEDHGGDEHGVCRRAQALANTIEIADKVETYDIDHAPIMPFFAIPEEFGTEEEYRSRITREELFNEFTRDENGNVVLSEEEANKKSRNSAATRSCTA